MDDWRIPSWATSEIPTIPTRRWVKPSQANLNLYMHTSLPLERLLTSLGFLSPKPTTASVPPTCSGFKIGPSGFQQFFGSYAASHQFIETSALDGDAIRLNPRLSSAHDSKTVTTSTSTFWPITICYEPRPSTERAVGIEIRANPAFQTSGSKKVRTIRARNMVILSSATLGSLLLPELLGGMGRGPQGADARGSRRRRRMRPGVVMNSMTMVRY